MLDKLKASIKQWIAEGFVSAGHSLTGEFERDIDVIIQTFGKDIVLEAYIRDYGKYLETGVPYNKIPFQLGSGAGSSLYIKGLMDYARKRFGLSNVTEQKSAAFAIAYTQKYKRAGMPIRTAGRGTSWLTSALARHDNDVTRFVSQWATREMELVFDNIIRKYQYKFNVT